MLDWESYRQEPEVKGVSVVIPAYGAVPFLAETIASVQDQTDVNVEIIVVLDRPSLEAKQFTDQISKNFQNIKVIESAKPGISAALNQGILNSSFPIIARIDADDLMIPYRLTKQFEFLSKHPEIDCVGSQVEFFGGVKGKRSQTCFPTVPIWISRGLKIRNVIAHPSVMYRKNKIIEAGLYRSEFNGGEDYDLWLRLDNGKNIANLSSALTKYRIHEEQITRINSGSQLEIDCQIRNSNLIGIQSERRVEPFKLRRVKLRLKSAKIINQILSKMKRTGKKLPPPGLIVDFLKALTLSPTQTYHFMRIFIFPLLGRMNK